MRSWATMICLHGSLLCVMQPAAAQESLCAPGDLADEVQCLREQVQSLSTELALTREREALARQELVARLRAEIGLLGPPKDMIPVSAGPSIQVAFWGSGQWHDETPSQCTPAPVVAEGMTLFGVDERARMVRWGNAADLGGDRDVFLACREPLQCDGGSGEYCESYWRSAGCAVSATWLQWHTQKLLAVGRVPTVETVCID